MAARRGDEVNWTDAALFYGVVLLTTLTLGASIGAALGLAGLLGIILIGGGRLLPTIGDIVWNTMDSFTLTAVPLFVLMGALLLQGGISRRLYNGLSVLLYSFHGSLAQANIGGCAIFSAICGSSTATTLTIGTIALPEMRARGYNDRVIFGTLAGGGCLGILIPPSIPMVIYAAMVQESVVDLFMAGVVPGVLLALMFMLWNRVMVALWPGLFPPRTEQRPRAADVLRAVRDCAPVAMLIVAIIGGMYFGVMTPTEAAGVGCLLVLMICAVYRELTWSGMGRALRSAVTTNAVIMFIIVNSQILSYALTTAGIGQGLSQWLLALGLGQFTFFLCLFVLYLVLGMFIDGISMMMLSLPLLYPSIRAFGLDGVLFGVIMVVFIELGQLTPPMGMNLFAIKSIAVGSRDRDIALAAMPFALIISLLCFLLYFYPPLALWLPASLK